MSFSFFKLKNPAVVGILNVTPDSFFDGGKYFLPQDALKRALAMVAEGADMIDIGALSTRPGSIFVDEETERERLLPALKQILDKIGVPVSVDTFRPNIARAALECGASVINDVSGFFNNNIASLVNEYGAGWILTHTGGRGVGAGDCVVYENGVLASVQRFFDDVSEKAAQMSVLPERICLDPGFGFSKNSAENTELLSSLNMLNTHSHSLMCALSRKRFISDYARVNGLCGTLEGTLAADKLAYKKGASLFRVHDVAEHVNMFNYIDKK